MAQIQAKQKDNKYAHLSKLYNDQQEEIVIAPADEHVEFKKEEIKIKRNDLIANIVIVAVLFAFASSGYLIYKFI